MSDDKCTEHQNFPNALNLNKVQNTIAYPNTRSTNPGTGATKAFLGGSPSPIHFPQHPLRPLIPPHLTQSLDTQELQ